MLTVIAIITIISPLYGAWGAWQCRHNRDGFRDLVEEFATLTFYMFGGLLAACWLLYAMWTAGVYLVS